MTDKPEAASEIAEIRKRNGFALSALAEDRYVRDQNRSDLIAWIAQAEGNVAALLSALSAKAAEVERLRAALAELAAALDHESDQQGGKARVLARLFDAHALLAEVK